MKQPQVKTADDVTKAIALDNNYALAYVGRGIAYCNLKKYDLAIDDYTKTIKIDNNYAHSYYILGLMLEETRDFKTAINNYDKAAELYHKQGNNTWYEKAMNKLKKLRGY